MESSGYQPRYDTPQRRNIFTAQFHAVNTVNMLNNLTVNVLALPAFQNKLIWCEAIGAARGGQKGHGPPNF